MGGVTVIESCLTPMKHVSSSCHATHVEHKVCGIMCAQYDPRSTDYSVWIQKSGRWCFHFVHNHRSYKVFACARLVYI